MTETSTYLPLFREDGEWIERPDFMVLAALSQSNKFDTQHVYSTMLLEELNPDQTTSGMSDFAKDIEAKKIRGNLTQRIMAGNVVNQLARLASSTGEPPSINAARRLVAYLYVRHSGKHIRVSDRRKRENSFLREIEKSLSKYQSTLHLQAAAVYDPQLLESIEGDEEGLLRFLGIARAFEQFIDAKVVSASFKWTPWRVPAQIDSAPKIIFFSLTDQELAAAMIS